MTREGLLGFAQTHVPIPLFFPPKATLRDVGINTKYTQPCIFLAFIKLVLTSSFPSRPTLPHLESFTHADVRHITKHGANSAKAPQPSVLALPPLNRGSEHRYVLAEDETRSQGCGGEYPSRGDEHIRGCPFAVCLPAIPPPVPLFANAGNAPYGPAAKAGCYVKE